MWVITTFGFFSIVQEPKHNTLMVRARTKRDLQELRERHLPELGEIVEGADPDYKYSATAPREAVARVFGETAMSIDYRDLRDSVLALQGFRRATLYGRIWNILWTLQEEEHWFDPETT
ncbi:MAG: hypothetical protein A4E57_04512 [Syntrophorhabdaceae bacterium PtaU1.Bin034]|nr:MAG: hypothetical protein A4E57_04512 [Syntrophorhabdaceae bacterium PtaU1.Bin034]